MWQRYSQRIYRYLFRLTGDQQTAEDLTQETFFQAIRDLRRRPAPPENECGWLFRIATNRAGDHFRRSRRFAWLPFLHGRDCASPPDDPVAQLAEHDLVARTLAGLPHDTASLLLLKDGEGFTTHEVALVAGKSYEAVRKQLARGREAFRAEYLRLKGESDR